jgi:C4-dicarboxylate-specific signal transduction histidine kinase
MSLRQLVRLLLVEPHQVVQAAVERLIEQQKLPYVLETVASAQEAISRLRQGCCDAVLLDCTGGDGRHGELFQEADHTPLILLVDRTPREAVLGAIRQGAGLCPIDTANHRSWKLLPAVIESLLARRQRHAQQRVGQQFGELAHLQRLAGMNTGAPELAHELSQPLCAIADYAQACRHLAENHLGDSRDEVIDLLGRIAEQADRAGQIIRRVREFVRRADWPRSSVDLNDLIRELVVVLEVEARTHGVCLELALGRSLPKAVVDHIQIQQVITNLVRNAVQAAEGMPPPRRTVIIRTALCAENKLEVAVEDKGTGLQEEDLERWFEPFYTRKADGMGLGLSISRWIVEAHGGRLEAVPGGKQGTIVRFSLPVEGQGDDK